MTTNTRTIPKLAFGILAVAALAMPAFASITYVACPSGCGANTGSSYTVWQTSPGSAGLTFSMSPSTFAPGGNLVSGVYTDPTGTVFTGYSGASSIDTLMSVSGSALLQGVGGSSTGIEIALPANTYAVALDVSLPAGTGFTNLGVELGDHNVGATNYTLPLSGPGSVEFFAVISSTPLSELFIGSTGAGSKFQINDFEIGEEAPTPEASSIALIGSGLVVLGLLRRRRIQQPDRTGT